MGRSSLRPAVTKAPVPGRGVTNDPPAGMRITVRTARAQGAAGPAMTLRKASSADLSMMIPMWLEPGTSVTGSL